jgi:hypothetical protein
MVRPNYFVAELGGYEFKPFASGAYKINETFSFRCEKAEFPGKTLATNEDVGGGGTTLKLPYDVTYNDIQLSIICSQDKKERMFFDNWIDSIINPAGYDYTLKDSAGRTILYTQNPGLVNYYEDYAKGVTLSVKQLNAKAEVIMNFVMHDVYPISISAMNASWDETNSYQRFSVTLNYRYYTIPLVSLVF